MERPNPLVSVRSFLRLQRQNRLLVAWICLVFSTLLVAAGNVSQITALDHLGPFTVVWMRSFLAVMVLLPFALRESNLFVFPDRDTWLSILVGATYFAASIVTQQMAAYSTTATNLGFLVNMSAIFVPPLIWMLVGKRPEFVVWPASFTAIIGAFFVTGASVALPSVGDYLCLMAGFLDAVWIIALSHALTKCPAPATLTLAMFFATTVAGLAGSVTENYNPENLVTALPEVLWLGICVSGIGFLLSAKAQQVLPACVVAVMFTLEALFSAVFGRLLLDEQLSLQGFAGAGLVILSVLMLQVKLRPGRAQKSPTARAPETGG
jgi:drug/metabolite transporter (DMT)-like permease